MQSLAFTVALDRLGTSGSHFGGIQILVRKGHDPRSLDKLLRLGPHNGMDTFKPTSSDAPALKAPANSRNMAEMLASLAASPGAEAPEDWVDDG